MILITGIPNAGKTTYSKRFENVIHFDSVKGGRKRRDIVVGWVKEDNSLCVEGVYGKALHRKELVDASKTKNTCIWIDTPLEECQHREEVGRRRSTHIVKMCAETFEPPTFEEGWDEIIIIRGNNVERSCKQNKT